MNFKIIPILQCINHDATPLSRWIFRYPATEDVVKLHFGFCALKSEKETILVDCGVANNDELAKIKWPISFDGNTRTFPEILNDAGIDITEITKVILTHLHWDHAWNVDKLPNAKIYVQKTELMHSVIPYGIEQPNYGYMPTPGYENPPFTRVINRMVPVDGEAEIVPGVRVIPTPGHTVGSQSILVDTKDGTYAIIGDLSNLKKGYDEGYLPALYYSMGDCYESQKRLAQEDAEVLCFHDPKTYSRKTYG